MTTGTDRLTRLAGRFSHPDDDTPAAATPAADTATATDPAAAAPAAAAPAAAATVSAPPAPAASRRTKTPRKRPANETAAHIKRTFYVRADLVERIEAETRRLNYELGGVKLVEVLDAVLAAGLVDFPKLEADIRAQRSR